MADTQNGAPDRNRTCGLQFRKLALYPTELRARDGNYTVFLSSAHRVQKISELRLRKLVLYPAEL